MPFHCIPHPSAGRIDNSPVGPYTSVDDLQDDRANRTSLGAFMTAVRTRRSFVVVSTMLLLALLAVPSASALSVPITIKSAGTFNFTGPTCTAGELAVTDTLKGTSSHLGLLTATYPHCVNFADGTFTGTATFQAANGDELIVLLGGSADPGLRDY